MRLRHSSAAITVGITAFFIATLMASRFLHASQDIAHRRPIAEKTEAENHPQRMHSQADSMIHPDIMAAFTSPRPVGPVGAGSALQSDQDARANGSFAFERDFIGNERFNLANIEDLLVAENFPRRVEELRQQAEDDVDVRTLAEAYRTVAEQVSARRGNAIRVEALSCGLHVCVGTLVGGDAASYADWASDFHHEAGLGVAFRYRTSILPNGAPQLRVFFYADPSQLK
jgi:hypothetical protein